jgi:hypothetical protein
MSPGPLNVNPLPTAGERFEAEVGFVLRSILPERYLSSVCAFPCDSLFKTAGKNGRHELSFEVDFLLHLRVGLQEILLLLECKAQDVLSPLDAPPTSSQDWMVKYGTDDPSQPGRKSVKDQLRRQAETLMLNVEPLEGRGRLKCWGVVMGRNLPATARPLTDDAGMMRFDLVPFGGASAWLSKLSEEHEILRVQQSPILRRLRQGQAVPELGHPEVANAVAYARRVRGFLDTELFRHFTPGHRRWAINGSAGMGKSVLLGYALTAAVTDRIIDHLGDGTPLLQSFAETADRIGMVPLAKRRIILAAHSAKQQQMLEGVYRRFEARYHEIDRFNEYRRIKPSIKVWAELSDEELEEANVLLVDEAHDLGPSAQSRLQHWHESNPENYLIVACDRHQKLRHTGPDARILDGFDFSRCTTRLVRNYRNPFAVYSAALGLMFRWFAAAGPKVIPAQDALHQGLGFEQRDAADGEIRLQSREDAHPGNNWHHLVGTFGSPQEAIEQLRECHFRKEDLLWVRFGEEDPTFSYEDLNHFTYHPLYGPDAPALTDKYIKGQEFPVVVIEGLPLQAAWTEIPADLEPGEAERQLRGMWEARRMVYLATSRATLFLFFILPAHSQPEFKSEVANLIRQLSRPPAGERQAPSGKTWALTIKQGDDVWPLPRYLRAMGSETADDTSALTSADQSRDETARPDDKPVPPTEPPPGLSVAAAVQAEALPEPPGTPPEEETSGTPSPPPEALPGRSEPAPQPAAASVVEPVAPQPPPAAPVEPPRAPAAPAPALVTPGTPSEEPAVPGLEALAHIARAAAPQRPELIPVSAAEALVFERKLRQQRPSPTERSPCRPAFLAALDQTRLIEVWGRLAGKPPSGQNEVAILRFIRALLAGKDLPPIPPGLGVGPEPQGPRAATKPPLKSLEDLSLPGFSAARPDSLAILLRLISPPGAPLIPESESERLLAVDQLKGVTLPARLRQKSRPAYVSALQQLSARFAQLRTAAKKPATQTDSEEVRLARLWVPASPPPLRPVPVAPPTAFPVVRPAIGMAGRQCLIARPITPFRLAAATDLPRYRVIDTLIRAGYRTFSEHMELEDEVAHEIAAKLGRKLKILTSDDGPPK